MKRQVTLASVLALALLIIPSQSISAPKTVDQTAGWYDIRWAYRRPVAISDPCAQEVTQYQVRVILDGTFDFSHVLADGGDLRVTDGDGVTPIPFWIEEWDPGAQTARIWVRVPAIPIEGTTVYLYYGNPTPPGPALVEVPPIGPWTKAPGNPIVPIGDPGNGASLLAENMVYDSVTGYYWLSFANYRDGSVGLAWSDDPGDPAAWHWQGSVIASANAPRILQYGGVWYIFYATSGHISVASSASVAGPYTFVAIVLTATEPWEDSRVDEPYVFQRADGKWILMYMGDEGSTTERIGYAIADDLLGPYTKFAGNPCLDFGPPGSFDAGTVADPWVVEFQGTYYIGYTVSPTKSRPWRTAYATTTDWLTFTKHTIILGLGPDGAWDDNSAFRGAVSRFGDIYYFPYTGNDGSTYRMGLATQPAWMLERINDPDEVFDFYDGFEGDALDASKWQLHTYGGGGTVTVSSSVITVTAQPGTTSGYVEMWGTPYITTSSLLESYARHPDAGLNAGPMETNTAGELGYKASDWSTIIRVLDLPDLEYYTIQATTPLTTSGYVTTSVQFDTDWHAYRIYRSEAGTAEFQIDDHPAETLGPPYVPTVGIRPWMMSYARQPAPQSRFVVDWFRVRKYCGAEPQVAVGAEQRFAIALAKTPARQAIPPGGDASFTIVVTNTGAVDLANVVVVDPLASDCDRTFSSLAPGSNASYTCTVVDVTADWTNQATVTGTVTATGYVSDTGTAFVDVRPTIELTKTAEPAELFEPGGMVTFSIEVANRSTEPVTITSLTDSVHGDLNGQGTCSIPQTLETASTYACFFSAVVSGVATYVEIDQVTASATDDDGSTAEASDYATVTITVAPAVVVSPTTLTISEPDGSDAFTITLTSQPTATVDVPLSPSNGVCQVAPTTVTLDATNWRDGVSATVSAVNDDVHTGDRTCVVETGPTASADSYYDGLDPADVTVTVQDDDPVGIVVTPTVLVVSEPDGWATFVISLTSQPTAIVHVPLSPSNGACQVVSATVALNAANWREGVSATVSAVNDDVHTGDRTCVVETGPTTSADSYYDGLDPADVTVTVLDDDPWRVFLPVVMRHWPPIPDRPTLDPIDNLDGVGTYMVRWSAAAGAEVYVLEEAKDNAFAVSAEVCVGPATSCEVRGRGAARYYYRVKARNSWGDGAWSNVEWTDVLWEAEPNDALNQANGPLVSGLTYYGTFTSTADVNDFFYFDLPFEGYVELWLTNIPPGQDYDLFLRNAAGGPVDESRQTGNRDEHIRVDNRPAGRHYIWLLNYEGPGSPQPYHLRVAYGPPGRTRMIQPLPPKR